MDTSQTITHISLCSGYGGIDLGLRRCVPGLRTIAYSEIEAAACELLLARMEGGQLDPAPIWSDLKSFPWGAFHGKVDILSGGYPCQPFSSAGKRAGKDDPRHLWPWIAEGICILKPAICLFENVEGHITLGLSTVVSDLEEMGYKVSWGIFSAAECGAPHQRKRVFILANREGEGLERYGRLFAGCRQSRWHTPKSEGPLNRSGNGGDVWPSRPGEPQHAWEPPRVVGNAESGDGQRSAQGQARHAAQPDQSVGNAALLDGTGQAAGQRKAQAGGTSSTQHDRQAQPALGGDTNGPAGGLDYGQLCVSSDNRTDELRMLGNGVVPATAEIAFRTLMNELC